jgi:carbon-monoxide dehydrogenase medium subunit
MIPSGFEYTRARSVDEALDALAVEDAKAIAGGHSLIPMMKLRFARPSRLVDIAGLDFRGVRNGEGVTIGALTTYDELTRHNDVSIPDALRECAAAIGDMQVRNAGTVGGGIAHADPASDIAAGVLALDAMLHLVSSAGERTIRAEEFFLGPFMTALGPQELLRAIAFDAPSAVAGSAYVSFEDHASGYPIAGAGVVVTAEGGRLTSCQVGLTGITGHPIRAREVEAVLLSAGADERGAAIHSALPAVELGVDEEDRAYRHQIASVVIARAVERAVARTEETK